MNSDIFDIKSNIERVWERIIKAAERSGRSADSIKLIGVTKTVPPGIIKTAIKHGLTDFGENRVQELCEKVDVLGNYVPEMPETDAVSGTDAVPEAGAASGSGTISETGTVPGAEKSEILPRWHLIGHLQTNKVKYIADKVFLLHSVDSSKLMKELNKRAGQKNRIIDFLIQVNVSGEESKSGIKPEDTEKLVEEALKYENIRLRGMMTIAPLLGGEEAARLTFRRLNKIFIDIGQKYADNICMDYISMGMSGDFEIAIEEGSNMVRVGSAIFGHRYYK